MLILYLTDNFVPETNSPALRAFEHARVWAREGAEVRVITSVPNFPTGRPLAPYRNRPQTEILDGVQVTRVWTFMAPNKGVALRSLDFLSFAITSFIAGLFETPDVVLASSPQLLTGLSGWWLATIKRRPWILEVRDLWPESIVSVGAMRSNLLIRLLGRLEKRLYRHATRIVTVSDGLRNRLLERGVPAEKVAVVYNGVNLSRATPRKKNERLLRELGFDRKFVVGYVGTHGMAQGLEVVLDAANGLRGSDVRFLLVGDGARRDAVVAHAHALKLDNTALVGLVPIAEAAEYLSLCDVVLVPLKRTDQIEITLPAKVFEAAAMEKPMIVAAGSAAADLVSRYGAGLVVPPEDPEALAKAIERLRDEPDLLHSLKAGCRKLADDFDRDRLAIEMLDQLKLTAGRSPSTQPPSSRAC